jgi:hypothetical protein
MGVAMRQKIRKIVSTILIGAMLFFAPSMIPIKAVPAVQAANCTVINNTWLLLPVDTAFAGGGVRVVPCPAHGKVPAWPWVVIGCAGSIVLSALAANFWQHRELTKPEAWTCGLLYWVQPYQANPGNGAVRAKG